jgi:hypothetical protein
MNSEEPLCTSAIRLPSLVERFISKACWRGRAADRRSFEQGIEPAQHCHRQYHIAILASRVQAAA